jgi:hypothetical protein
MTTWHYDPCCDWYVKRTVVGGKLQQRCFYYYYYGHTNIPRAGGLTNKPKSGTILYQKLLEKLNVPHKARL